MDGALIGVAPVTIRLPVGPHRVRVMSAGYHSQELDFRVTPTQPMQPTTKLFVALQIDRAGAAPAPAAEPIASDGSTTYPLHAQGDPRQTMLRHLGTVGIAAGVLALGGALVLEVMRSQAATSAQQEVEQIRFAEALDRTHSRQTWARVLAGTGGVLTALGVTLLVLSRGTSRASEASVALTCAPGECSAQLRGAF
jgi:PEGA domain